MLAIIMAGGEGARLRPLTCRLPKPMAPLLGKPVMEYALDHLAAHGFTKVTATLQYRPEEIQGYFGDRIGYMIEDEPLGTAGGVKRAAGNCAETLLVTSGDALTDIDFTAAYQFHKESGAAATLVLTRVQSPQEFGVVVTGENGKIQKFLEKPRTGDVLSDTVNTGIYLLEPMALERIPEGVCDFGKDFFPKALADGLPLYGYITNDYWCDIGDISAYLSAHRDALDGRISYIKLPENGIFVHEEARVHESARLEAPCYIDAGAVVRGGARIGPYTVLGRGTAILENASAARSILWEGAVLESDAEARGALLLNEAQMGRQAQAYEGAVVGERTLVGAGAVLSPGALVWPYKQVEPGMRISGSLVWGGGRASLLYGRGLRGGRNALTTEDCVALGAAMFAAVGDSCALTDHGTGGSRAAADAFSAGYMGAGGRIYRLGTGTPQSLRFSIRELKLSGGCAVRVESGSLVLDLYGPSGAELTDAQMRSCKQAFLRRDRAPVALERVKTPVDVRGARGQRCLAFTRALRTNFPGGAGNPISIRVESDDLAVLRDAREMLEPFVSLSNSSSGVICARIAPDGETFELTDERERRVMAYQHPQLFTMAVSYLYPSEGIIIPSDASRAVEAYATSMGMKTERRAPNRHAMLEAISGESLGATLWNAIYFDAAGALYILARYLLESRQALADAMDSLLPSYIRQITVPIRESEKASAMRRLTEATQHMNAKLGSGIQFERELGWAVLSPNDDTPEFRVVCEAFSSEAADELAGFCIDLLKDDKGQT